MKKAALKLTNTNLFVNVVFLAGIAVSGCSGKNNRHPESRFIGIERSV